MFYAQRSPPFPLKNPFPRRQFLVDRRTPPHLVCEGWDPRIVLRVNSHWVDENGPLGALQNPLSAQLLIYPSPHSPRAASHSPRSTSASTLFTTIPYFVFSFRGRAPSSWSLWNQERKNCPPLLAFSGPNLDRKSSTNPPLEVSPLLKWTKFQLKPNNLLASRHSNPP